VAFDFGQISRALQQVPPVWAGQSSCDAAVGIAVLDVTKKTASL
jgi:hypothetical protein